MKASGTASRDRPGYALIVRVILTGLMLCTALLAGDVSDPIVDESLRMAALQAIFPGMQISVEEGKRIDDSWRGEFALQFPDALANEIVYKVVGRATYKAEKWAAGDVISERVSSTRRVRFKIFSWPKEDDSGLVAVLQYDFPTARPPQSCPSLGLLVHLAKGVPNWQVKERFLLETTHHHSLQRIELLNFGGFHDLVVESNYGGAGLAASSFQVFDLSRGTFHEILNTDSRNQGESVFTQSLDMDRTMASQSRRFCFVKTVFAEHGRSSVTHPCRPRGEGVQNDDAGRRGMLTPVRH